MKNFICIHGHFYQPPRENPWLETIEVQMSAAPFHDWNERIASECYAPNSAARLLNAAGDITSLSNNYQHISFNFGPTLLSWIEHEEPSTYDSILAADAASRKVHNGHGAAIAQAWGHIILPLANSHDKRTQVLWGMTDFKTRFGRMPEGMWLPEAAVDIESLELLAEAGIRFTILSPQQARSIRPHGTKDWKDIHPGEIDSRQPYLCHLPSGRTIAIFFYAGSLSHEVAFGGLLDSGDAFATALKEYSSTDKEQQLTHVATDGESYGHHHKFGEMALARAIQQLKTDKSVKITLYGAYLEDHPPKIDVDIIPMSSWSCAHGVERWRSDCGCHIGSNPSWNQKWRAPLRNALDSLRDHLSLLFEKSAGVIFRDPWGTRDAYIEVVLDRDPKKVKIFLAREASHPLLPEEERRGLELLEMQRHAMQMYTSCGWFFDEVSGIETVQLLNYAARAIDYARSACGIDLEPDFREKLRLVPSNLPKWPNADAIYQKMVIPQRVEIRQVAANYAIALLLGQHPGESFYCYAIESGDLHYKASDHIQLVAGSVRLRSKLTWEEESFYFAALRLGGLNVLAGLRPLSSSTEEDAGNLLALFDNNDPGKMAEELKILSNEQIYTLKDLFHDERQNNAKQMISSQVTAILELFRTIYQDHQSLLSFFHENDIIIPAPLAAAAEQLINQEILQILHEKAPLSGRIHAKLESAKAFSLKLDESELIHVSSQRSHDLLVKLAKNPDDLQQLTQTVEDLEELLTLPWSIDLWHAQNSYFDLYQRHVMKKMAQGKEQEEGFVIWMEKIHQLAKVLGISL